MSSTVAALPMYLGFLRPLALPRAATLTRFLSTTAAKIPKASTIKTTATASAPQPGLPKVTAESIAALPYRVNRTASNSLPVFILRKRGGNLHQTRLRKIEGNIIALKADLQAALQLEEKDIAINQLTKHILIRGHRKPDVTRFLKERRF